MKHICSIMLLEISWTWRVYLVSWKLWYV